MSHTWGGNRNTVGRGGGGLVANLPVDDAGPSGTEGVHRTGLGILESPVRPIPFRLPSIKAAHSHTHTHTQNEKCFSIETS